LKTGVGFVMIRQYVPLSGVIPKHRDFTSGATDLAWAHNYQIS